LPEGPSGEVETDRMVRRYFQECLEPRDGRSEPHPTLLTARETDVLELLRRGLVDKEIAGELGLSVWTVHSHLKRIFAKLGVRTRTEAVVRHLQK
jgi:DNA-binding NarL/FixJ family response regulator